MGLMATASVGLALALDLSVEEFPDRMHPVALFGRVVGLIDRSWRRPGLAGTAAALALPVVPAVLAGALTAAAARASPLLAVGIATLALFATTSLAMLCSVAAEVILLSAADVKRARERVPALVGRDAGVLSPAVPTSPTGCPTLALITRAIRYLVSFDLLVVTRGGGAGDTLRMFDELAVCRTVARTETPIAVGVGHENDLTLAGEVADVRIMTPTDAGRFVPERAEYEEAIERCRADLSTAYATAVRARLDDYAHRVDDAYCRRVGVNLSEYRAALERAAGSTIERTLSTTATRLETASKTAVETQLRALATDLNHAYDAVLQENRHKRELRRAIESTKADVTATVEAAADAEIAAVRRRYRIAVAVLLVLVAGLLVALAFT